MDSENKAIPAVVFILILLTVAMWVMSMCRDGTYHCNTKRRSSFTQNQAQPIVRLTPEITSYTSNDIYQRMVYEDMSSSDSSKHSTPYRASSASPRSRPAPYAKNDKCTRSGRKY